ncbi:methyltransferase family protein [Nanoarchaeota archaeon]
MKQRLLKKFFSSLGLGESRKEDRNSLPLIFLAATVVTASTIIETAIKQPGLNPTSAILGFSMFLAGLALRLTGQFTLGKQFDMRVRILKDHEIIDTGIYRHIRHPMYTGFILIFAGLPLALQSWVGTASALILFTPSGLYRIRIEEAALMKKFGKKYRAYMSRTERLIPFIW